MPSVFISYSHDRDDPKHAERVAGLAASLLSDGLEVFFDQKRGGEEKVPWPIWMEDKIEVADYVLLVCTDVYLNKVRQKVAAGEGCGVCWEANLIYNLLYERKLNTAKFIPVLLSQADEAFVPGPLKGTNRFVLNSQAGYNRLYAFLTGQHRTLFPEQSATLQLIPQRTVQPLFGPAGKEDSGNSPKVRAEPRKVASVANLRLILKPDLSPAPRQDVRGLDWYDECDSAHFLGREDDANRLLAMLLSHPVIRLVGPSGVGKSSLIRAGLLPRIREFGWRACVIRPFENPAVRVVPQLMAGLLVHAGKFTALLDPVRFRAEVTPLLSAAGITRLVLLIDQFEDIVSPMADSTAVDSMREFLQEIWQQAEARPCFRAVIVYRTDADARLGRLWQDVSGRPEGLPYLALQGLSRDVAERIIGQTGQDQGWALETSVPEIVRQLVQESQALGYSGEVFPVYLQIFLKQVQLSANGRVTTGSMARLGGVSGLIGRFLEQTLVKLKARGGDWQHCGVVLEALSRSAGTKAVQSLDDLVRETGLGRAVLVEMLSVLIDERLVRPVGHEAYEIQHDRLAVAVIESMKSGDRDAKAARDFLAAKVPAFQRARTALAPGDLVYLFRHRHRIHPTEQELRIILASISYNRSVNDDDPLPGWFWFHGANPKEWWDIFCDIERWHYEDGGFLQQDDSWPMLVPAQGLKSILAAAASDPHWRVREMCASALRRAGRRADLWLLRKLAKDDNPEVRVEATRGLAATHPIEALPVLRELSRDADERLRAIACWELEKLPFAKTRRVLIELAEDMAYGSRSNAVQVLARFATAEDLPLLRRLARDAQIRVRLEAAKALARLAPAEALKPLRELVGQKESWVRSEVAKTLSSFPTSQSLPLLTTLAKDDDSGVRIETVRALPRSAPSRLLKLVREFSKDENGAVRLETVNRIGRFARDKALPLLDELVGDTEWRVRLGALKALARFGKPEALPLLRKMSKDRDPELSLEAAKALADLTPATAVPLLRELAKSKGWYVRVEAAEALAAIAPATALPVLQELVLSVGGRLAEDAVRIFASLCSREELEVFLNEHDQQLSAEALGALDEELYMPDWLK